MATRKNPEERSATAQPQPAQVSAKPTGGEVYQSGQKGGTPSGSTHLPDEAEEAPVTEEQAAEVEVLLSTASEYYERLAETAVRLSAQAGEAYDSGRTLIRDRPGSTLLGAFAVGIIVGMIFNRS